MAAVGEWLNYAPKPRDLRGDDKWHVFLSYRSINRAWVINLYDVLRELGYKVFLDQVRLKAGDRLIKELQAALMTSQAGVLIWSSATADSEWVQREYETLEQLPSDKEGFQFVPIRLDNSKLPPFVKNRIFIDFVDYPDGPNGGELLRLLYGIAGLPLTEDAARFATAQSTASAQAVNKIKAAIDIGSGKRLIALFQEGGLPWRVSAALGCKAAEGLTRLGQNEDALTMLKQLEAQFPTAIRPKQLRALAMARHAAKTKNVDGLEEAQGILAELYAAGEHDPETLGIYGRTWMDRYDIDKAPSSLRRSRDLYAQAFEGARDDYYTGINAAAKSVLLDTPADLLKAAEYAARVVDIVGTKAWPGDYWKTATAAEAALIKKEYEAAAPLYQAAVDMAPTETGSHGSSWGQASRLMVKLGTSLEDRALVRKPFSHIPE